jgi:hypothetical protein
VRRCRSEQRTLICRDDRSSRCRRVGSNLCRGRTVSHPPGKTRCSHRSWSGSLPPSSRRATESWMRSLWCEPRHAAARPWRRGSRDSRGCRAAGSGRQEGQAESEEIQARAREAARARRAIRLTRRSSCAQGDARAREASDVLRRARCSRIWRGYLAMFIEADGRK